MNWIEFLFAFLIVMYFVIGIATFNEMNFDEPLGVRGSGWVIVGWLPMLIYVAIKRGGNT